eukprot:TRINITY_DN8876_c0_g2_i1.p1 TRINITY_DN8876_c0_g2~~TRINITY_DN8876_c0_g2_i1.p1  ORF type:complete len:408 (-),score=99.47 TRINITY_DN8876_c0_g2_i1:157-1380(-)
MQRGLVGSEMCIRDRYQRRVHGVPKSLHESFWRATFIHGESECFAEDGQPAVAICRAAAAALSGLPVTQLPVGQCLFHREGADTMSNDRPSPAQYQAILESISDGVFTVDEDWLISSFNSAAEAITGISRDEAIGKRCSDVFRSSMCNDQCCLRETKRTGKAQVGRTGYIIDAAGNRIPISLSTAVLRNAEGVVIGWAETFRDLSEVEALRNELDGRFRVGDLVSRSPLMQRVFSSLGPVAASSSTVLILGETGTGKERIARTIHNLSPRKDGPFVAVNCGALPETLLESELFGYKAGAFTGASKDKPGRFSLASGGVLFLDEIGNISPAMQVRLLRVLQEREFDPLGSVAPEKTDVRIIAATNSDVADMVRQGTFREDFYYRINIARVELPPLRLRKEDILSLIHI